MDCTLTLAMPQSSASGFAPTPFTWRVMTYVFIGAAAAIVQVRAGLEEESGAQNAPLSACTQPRQSRVD